MSKNSFLFYIYIEWQMFKFTVATFQEICKSNHYAVHLKLQCWMSICILIKLGKKIKWWGCGENGAPGYYWQECKLVQSLWKTIWWFLKKLKIGLPYNPAIPFLGIYPRKQKQDVKVIYVLPLSMQQILFTIAKIWKQLKYPSMDKWIKMWYPLEEKMATHSSMIIGKIPWTEEPGRLQSMGSQSQMRLSTHTFTVGSHRVGHDWSDLAAAAAAALFSHKKEENPAICSNMNKAWGHYTTSNKPQRERKLLVSLTCGIFQGEKKGQALRNWVEKQLPRLGGNKDRKGERHKLLSCKMKEDVWEPNVQYEHSW